MSRARLVAALPCGKPQVVAENDDLERAAHRCRAHRMVHTMRSKSNTMWGCLYQGSMPTLLSPSPTTLRFPVPISRIRRARASERRSQPLAKRA